MRSFNIILSHRHDFKTFSFLFRICFKDDYSLINFNCKEICQKYSFEITLQSVNEFFHEHVTSPIAFRSEKTSLRVRRDTNLRKRSQSILVVFLKTKNQPFLTVNPTIFTVCCLRVFPRFVIFERDQPGLLCKNQSICRRVLARKRINICPRRASIKILAGSARQTAV